MQGIRGILINQINDNIVKLVAQLMVCKLSRKCRKYQCSRTTLKATEMCVMGVQMSWAPFLLNQFILGCREAH